MNNSIYHIPWLNLAFALLPVLIVIFIHYRWSLRYQVPLYALARMVLQLILIGFVLIYIFEMESPWLVILVLCFMLGAASWIAIRPIRQKTPDGVAFPDVLKLWLEEVPLKLTVPELCVKVPPCIKKFLVRLRLAGAVKLPASIIKSSATLTVPVPPLKVPPLKLTLPLTVSV